MHEIEQKKNSSFSQLFIPYNCGQSFRSNSKNLKKKEGYRICLNNYLLSSLFFLKKKRSSLSMNWLKFTFKYFLLEVTAYSFFCIFLYSLWTHKSLVLFSQVFSDQKEKAHM